MGTTPETLTQAKRSDLMAQTRKTTNKKSTARVPMLESWMTGQCSRPEGPAAKECKKDKLI
jgi:hypothetical protein